MKLYFAPLEGITGFAYRNAHHKCFVGVNQYYTPFIAPNYTHHMKTREREDIDSANNEDVPLVPQILTNRPDDFIWAVGELYAMGYREINLNLGCPMPTVARKGRGAGQLGDLDTLDRFLDSICTGIDNEFGLQMNQDDYSYDSSMDKGDSGNCNQEGINNRIPGKIRISVKTRIGTDSSAHADELLEIYNRYPISELTVHPRTQKDLYKGVPDLEVFSMFLENSIHPVVYNGNIFTTEDYYSFHRRFPACDAIMLGRGLIANPALAREISGGEPLKKAELQYFHDLIFASLSKTLPGTNPLIGKMKELWYYMGRNFESGDRYLKEIRKSRTIPQYQAAVRMLFARGEFCGVKIRGL